ncbi:uncharacterized protein Tco025E_03755 [Trypanosoma conorhini]|uniref:Uncharacterized protein n=1 Tax=Trypanosoma conorhini TaxID=83891 RepID=A0A3R7PAT1_9TRYP|nr:uncharacterized protein Tco025E_03755 [Trypanosoma conorhini]RNF20493.1 hypothetical protein Tco025E_03755 [Trypanosoma conorhini]
MSGAPFIPELPLGTVETGGGWGVGEQFARLPPASVQAESRTPVYTVARERSGDNNDTNDSDEDSVTQEGSAGVEAAEAETVPTTHYRRISAEDDNTFVDHGSTAPPAAPGNDVVNAVNTGAPHSMTDFRGGRSPNQGPTPAHSLHVKFLRPVSRMMAGLPVRATVVAPDGASLWVAFGDDPVTMLDFKGSELNISRTVDVTQVHAMAVVRVPAAKVVSFKPSSLAVHHASHAAASKPQMNEGDEADTYVLWCGITRGSIVIVDLTNFSISGVIKGAHAQTISGLWYLGTGKVWTAGYDKALKVWDPQTRRRLKSRNIATIVSDLCYVRSCKQVWTISDDAYIRVFDAAGNNVQVAKPSPDKPENTLRMRSEMRFIAYYEPATLVYVALTRSLAAIDPATCEITAVINASISSMTFMENTALVTGYGEWLQCTKEAIGLIDLSDPYAPSLLFRGGPLGGGVTSVGMRLLTAVPFAVAAQEAGRSERFLSVFSYEDSKAFCRGGIVASVPQQRKITLDAPSTRRPVAALQQGVTAANATAASTPLAAISPCPVAFAIGKRGLLIREESNATALPPHRGAVVFSRVDGSSGGNSTLIPYPNLYTSGSSTNNNKYVSVAATSAVSGSTNRSTAAAIQPDYGRNVNKSSLNGGVEQRNIAVQLTTPPELLASLNNIEKKTEDLKSLLAQMRASRPLLDDFSKLHALVSRMAMNNQLGLSLDAEESEAIEREYQSLEGRVIVSAVERLHKSAAASLLPAPPNSTRVRESIARRDNVGSEAATPQLLSDRCPHSVTEIMNSSKLEETGSVGGSEIPPESLLRWVAQITRSGQGERESHRRQLETLQRHNTRIVERNAALINGITRIEQALRTQAQRLLEDADAAAAAAVASSDGSCDSSGHLYAQRHIQLLSQSLQQIESVSVSSSPKEITELMRSLVTLISRLLSAQQFVHGDEGARRAPYDSTSGNMNHDAGLDTTRVLLQNGGTLLSGRSLSPKSTAMTVSTMRPQRMRGIVEDQIASVEEFVRDVGKFWGCLEETQKVIYVPYEGGKKPDLFQDFMQFGVLWHLREAQVMVDVCRKESVMAMAEVLLPDIESKEGTVDNTMMGATRDTAALAAPEKAVHNNGASSSKSNSVTVNNATSDFRASSSGVAVAARSDSARLVSIGLELESVASHIRESLKESGRNLQKGIAREAFGGFFLIPNEKFLIDATKLRGMLYWERVSMHLLYECLECLEELLFHSDEQPRVFRKDNFKALEQQVVDWRVFLEDVHGESTQLRSVILSSQQEGGAGRTSTTTVGSSVGFTRSGSLGSRELSRNNEGDTLSPERSMQWVMLFGLYVQYAERTEATPILFASHDPSDTVTAADFGLMALLDEFAEVVETVRAKSAALLRYCQKIQGRIARIVEDVVVNEETGQVFVPACRGGPIAERYCKGFCHDMN